MATEVRITITTDADITEEAKARLRAELGGETVDIIEGARADAIASKDVPVYKEVAEKGKAKDTPKAKIV